MKYMPNRSSIACEVRMNIRCGVEMSYQTLAQIIRNEIPYEVEYHTRYLLGFFEECPPDLIRCFMKEQNISREEIIDVFYRVPDSGEKYKFARALANGEF